MYDEAAADAVFFSRMVWGEANHGQKWCARKCACRLAIDGRRLRLGMHGRKKEYRCISLERENPSPTIAR